MAASVRVHVFAHTNQHRCLSGCTVGGNLHMCIICAHGFIQMCAMQDVCVRERDREEGEHPSHTVWVSLAQNPALVFQPKPSHYHHLETSFGVV